MAREMNLLEPELLEKLAVFGMRMAQRKIPFLVTCTGRTQAEHNAYYAQGREPLEKVNKLREKAKLWPITEQENRKPVTWTKKSAHLTANGKKSRAFDFVIIKNGNLMWSMCEEYQIAGGIAAALGLEWGGNWSKDNLDVFHVQLKE